MVQQIIDKRLVQRETPMVVVHFDGAGHLRGRPALPQHLAWSMRFKEDRVVEVTAFFDTRLFDEMWRQVKPGAVSG